jgi:ribosomal protein S18 acetylase RimI-like enzyme
MSRRWPVAARRRRRAGDDDEIVHTRCVDGVTIRPLQNGDRDSVLVLFERLGPRSRERRFGGAKPGLSEQELDALTRVDRDHHVLVGYVDGDAEPVGIARLVREGSAGEIACAVADAHQGHGIGSVLMRALAGDARAAGITELHATVAGDNPPVVSLLTRIGRSFHSRWLGGEREFVVRLDP